jgi:hypothetical protein
MAPAPCSACFRFYAELNDHLPPGQQFGLVEKHFFVPASVKDMIESIGIPHAEVDLILVNGESSDFTRLIRNGDRVAVYPVFESIDITPVLRLRSVCKMCIFARSGMRTEESCSSQLQASGAAVWLVSAAQMKLARNSDSSPSEFSHCPISLR